MTNVGAYEAKTHLPSLLARVEAGEHFTITRHGRAIARLLPAEPVSPVEEVLADMLALRARVSGNFDTRELVADGRHL
jgi:prevent-host-death family protein